MPLPNLASLSIAPTPTGMPAHTRGAQQRLVRSLPPEVWREIFRQANRDGDTHDSRCDEVVNKCRVAANAPWAEVTDAQGRTVCGPKGWIYDQANEMMGFYRPHPTWAALEQWLEANPQERVAEDHPNGGTYPKWWENPRAYFYAACRARQDIKRQGDNFNFFAYIRAPVRSKPWVRQLVWEYLIKNPAKMTEVPYTDPDYFHFAEVVLLLAPWYLGYVPGTVRWDATNMHAQTVGPGPGSFPLPHDEFQQLCKVGMARDGMLLQYVPGSLNINRTVQSATPIPEYSDIAERAVQVSPQALVWVPGSNAVGGGQQAAAPIENYVAIAKIAVKKLPAMLQFVPGAVITVADHGQVPTPPNGITDNEFIQIARAAIAKTVASERDRLAAVARFVPRRLLAQVLGRSVAT